MFTRVFCRTKLPNTALLRLYGYTFDKKNIKTTRLRNSFFNGQRERKYYFFFGLKPASHYNYFTNFRFSLSSLNLPSVQYSVALIKTIICMEIIQNPITNYGRLWMKLCLEDILWDAFPNTCQNSTYATRKIS